MQNISRNGFLFIILRTVITKRPIMAKDNNHKLFTDFPPVSTEQWEKVINSDLKGADYEKKLVWKTIEGINVKPYYRAEDLQKIQTVNAQPGEFPFVRGNKHKGNQWLIRQDLKVNTAKPEETNSKARLMLERGVQAIAFHFNRNQNLTDQKNGSEIINKLLNGINLNQIEVNFVGGTNNSAYIFKHLSKYLSNNKLDTKNRQVGISLDFNPLTEFSLNGQWNNQEDATFALLANALQSAIDDKTNVYGKNLKLINVDANIFNDCGASIVQELAFALAMGANYLEKLSNNTYKLEAEQVAQYIKFNFSISSNYFMEIAKFRAARLLWAKLVDAFKPKDRETTKMHIHAVTSGWNQTVYDPYVNMLRSTTESMSAVIAGIDSLSVQPFDTPYAEASEFSERIARNQQLLLREESYFDKIADPAAGSYYIENLTAEIAQNAWKLFLEIDQIGGYTEAFTKGIIQEKIKTVANQRDTNFATRRETIVGTNQYPNFNEIIDSKLVDNEVVTRKYAAQNGSNTCTPLEPYRGSQAIEALRYRTDTSGKRPKVFTLTVGNLAMRRARAQFACNFFAVAGFEVVDNIGFKTVDEGLNAAIDAKADIVVICSSDEEYAELATETYRKLGNKAILVVAGNPSSRPELEKKGIKNFIHVKSNLLETLKEYQELLKI